MPSAAAIAFLKMRAWLDRPHEREKDLRDLAHLLAQYVGDDDDKRWNDDIIEQGLAFEDVSAFVLGSELGAILEAQHREHLDEFLGRATPEKLAAQGPWRDVQQAERAVEGFRRGLDNR